jgi:hypothetical protein
MLNANHLLYRGSTNLLEEREMKTAKLLLTIMIFSLGSTLFGQVSDNTWDQWKWIMGDWIGEGSGKPGEGNGKFSFCLDLDKNILVRKSSTEFPATNNRSAFAHEDLLIVYRDYSGIPAKAIYFDNENHVINYSVILSGKSIIFQSEKIPDVPVFRLTYTSLSTDYVNIKFEMSQDGENFMTYLEGRSKKLSD